MTKITFSPKANVDSSIQQAYTPVFPKLYSESKESTAVLAFGRLNPPTTGHAKLVDKMHEVGGKEHHKELVVSHSHDAKKNPLSSSEKLKHVRRYFTDLHVSASSKDAPTVIHHAKRLNQAGYQHLIMVAGSDRTHEYKQLLNKYNGKEYNFKSIKVVSAGKRDPDAEGTEGMSASKMREHAKAGNFKEFRKGVPSHVSDAHAKELYHDVRHGMSLKESVELTEGVHDASIFKAVFLAGGPGSGKDFVLKHALDGHGLVEINSDTALEFLMDKEGLSKKMPKREQEKREDVRKRAKSMTELRQRLALEGRNGLIINGTADDPEKIFRIKTKLEEMGYSTSMVFVNTTDKISKQRNIERGKRGGRRVPENIRIEKWKNAQLARPEFEKVFGDNMMSFDNSLDLRPKSSLDDETRKQKTKELETIWKKVKKFTEQGPEDPVAQSWIENSLGKQAEHPHVQKQFGLDKTKKVSVQDSEAAREAARLGLQYYGFGRYGKKGKVTHTVHQGRLHPVETKMPTTGFSSGTGPAKPVSESMMTESVSESIVDQLAQKHGVSPASIVAQLERGIEVEHEHTKDDTLAMQIALDHLKERPDYYTRLKQMEKTPVKRKSIAELRKSIQETSFGYDETTPEMSWGRPKDETDTQMGGRATSVTKKFLLKKKVS